MLCHRCRISIWLTKKTENIWIHKSYKHICQHLACCMHQTAHSCLLCEARQICLGIEKKIVESLKISQITCITFNMLRLFWNFNFFKTLVMVMVVAVGVWVHLPCLLKHNVCQRRLNMNHNQCSEAAELLENCTHLTKKIPNSCQQLSLGFLINFNVFQFISMLADLMWGQAFACLRKRNVHWKRFEMRNEDNQLPEQCASLIKDVLNNLLQLSLDFLN